jgi:hypothetical protein
MTRGFFNLVRVAALVLVASSTAFAQTSPINGVVTDSAGGVVPGAMVTVVNNATKVSSEQVSNTSGQFSFPGMPVGTYTVTVALGGFKTYVAREVRVTAGQPATVNAMLEIGDLTETVEVKAGSELVQTQSSTVTSTLSIEQLSEIPLASRNALYSVALLPGVSQAGGPRQASIMGLPNNTINITIDGVSTGNMLQSTDGFFSMVTPRMDAVEEITVTGAVPGSGGGAGSVQIQMVTRSGSNRFDGSVYHYWRQPDFNSNYYFNKINNLPKNQVTAHQYGFRQGGPIVIPGLLDGRNRAFFFFNFEHLYQPSSATRTRTFLRDSAMNGIFGYNVTVAGQQERREVNLVQVAQANGQLATFDPIVMSMLQKIRAATQTTGTVNDTGTGNTLQYVYQSEATGNQYSPTQRVDVNLSDRHRLSGSYWWQRFKSNPDLLNNVDPLFPGLANVGHQNSYRTTGNSTLRSTLGTNLVNELTGGWQWSPNDFFANVTAEQFADQGGYGLSFPLVTSPTVVITPQPRNTTTWNVNNTLNWLRGSHSLSMGGSYSGLFNRQNAYTVVPNIQLGFDANTDPANPMFNATNFPAATAGQLNEARALYALLTGRITQIPGTARLDSASGEYVYNGDLARKSRQSLFAAWLQDSWRVRPTLTLNAGLRWDLHLPFTPADNTWSTTTMEDICGISGLGSGPGGNPCNLFNPNASGGKLIPTYTRFEPGTPSFNTQWTNFSPNVGVAWRPDVQTGWLRTLLGDPDQATLRAGYGMSYNQERIDRFTGNAGNNPGGTLNVPRNLTTGYPLVLPGESHPVLFRETSRLGPPDYPRSPQYPIAATTANSAYLFGPDLRTPRVHSYSVGVQRSIGRDMAMEVRYVGNQNKYVWSQENWNERNFLTNGFLQEFHVAQANIAANIAANLGNRGYAFTGAPGTAPLPAHLAYFQGSRDSGNPLAYTHANFTNQTFINRFSPLNPNVSGALAAIDTVAFRANALNAGLPRNYMMLNPLVGGTFVVQDRNWTKYDSMQVELRRRLSRGLLVAANYTYETASESSNQTLHLERFSVDNTRVPHVFKMNWHYEVPVGRGRRFGGDSNRVVDAILGGWEFSGNGRLQSQRYRINDVVLEGMTVSDLQKEFKIRIERNAAGLTQVWSFPEDIRLNTWAAFSVDPTQPTGYSIARGVPTGRYIRPAGGQGCTPLWRGDCGATDVLLNGPLFSRWDMRIKKRFNLVGRSNVELMAEVLNVFDNINFLHAGTAISGVNAHNINPNNGQDTFRVTAAYTDINTTFDPGGRIGQIVWRVNW